MTRHPIIRAAVTGLVLVGLVFGSTGLLRGTALAAMALGQNRSLEQLMQRDALACDLCLAVDVLVGDAGHAPAPRPSEATAQVPYIAVVVPSPALQADEPEAMGSLMPPGRYGQRLHGLTGTPEVPPG